ncbi:hypothetical protein J6590_082309 [Homalodisca vitripennis]|nr:hypothetical protein J6590_082309 [Homalodisca vitripennis]
MKQKHFPAIPYAATSTLTHDLAAKGLRSEKERGGAWRGGRWQNVCSMLGGVGDDGETPSFDAAASGGDATL